MINVKSEIHTQVKLVSRLTGIPMTKVIEQAVLLYAKSVQETLRKTMEQNVKDLEAITQPAGEAANEQR